MNCKHHRVRGVFLCKLLKSKTMIERYKRPLVLVGLVGSLVAMLFLTDPLKLPLFLMPLPFMLIFTILYVSTKYFLHRLFPNKYSSRQKIAAFTVAIIPTLILVMSSIEQLTTRDLLLMVLIIVLAIFYARKSHIFTQ